MFERGLKILLMVFLSLGCNIIVAQEISTGDKSGVIKENEECDIFRFAPGNQGSFAAYGDNISRLNELLRTQEDTGYGDKAVLIQPEPSIPYSFIPKLAVKTNLLYWTGVMPDFKYYSFLPNLELEWFFNTRWSLVATGAYSKWVVRNDKFFGVSSWSLEPRYWLQDKNYSGFYIGLYGQVGDFDNQKLNIDEFGRTGDFFGVGVSIGAYIPFNHHWGMEIGIRGGYRNTENDIYSYEDPNYYLDYSETRHKWGITGIKVSMVYRFGTKIR